MIDYYEYIKSDAWFEKTDPIRNRNEGLCECCGMRYGMDVHHRTYQHLGEEKDEELIHICRTCHEIIHDKFDGEVWKVIWPSRMALLMKLRSEIQK